MGTLEKSLWNPVAIDLGKATPLLQNPKRTSGSGGDVVM